MRSVDFALRQKLKSSLGESALPNFQSSWFNGPLRYTQGEPFALGAEADYLARTMHHVPQNWVGMGNACSIEVPR